MPGGGLEAHEDAGGHLIERHVGKSEAELLERLRNENISASSSFRDLPEAERFVAETLAENQDHIDAWVDGQGGNRLIVNAASTPAPVSPCSAATPKPGCVLGAAGAGALRCARRRPIESSPDTRPRHECAERCDAGCPAENFLSAYFHQDWAAEHGSPDAVVLYFLDHESDDEIANVRREINRIAAPTSTNPRWQPASARSAASTIPPATAAVIATGSLPLVRALRAEQP